MQQESIPEEAQRARALQYVKSVEILMEIKMNQIMREKPRPRMQRKQPVEQMATAEIFTASHVRN